MSRLPKGSGTLAGKLMAIYIPLISLSVILLFTVIEVRSYVLQLDQLKRGLRSLVEFQSAAFTAAVWEYNDDQVAALLADLERSSHFRGAVVRDSFGEILGEAGEIEGADPELLAETALVYRTEHAEEEIGRFSLAFHRQGIHANLRQRILNDALVLAVLIVSLLAVTGLVTRLVIVQPIVRLRASIDRLRADNVREVVEWQSHDELGEVVEAYNEMQTKQAAAEAELTAYKEHLEHLVNERTAELREARDAADAANRAKSDFLSSMSHELRTPLNGVLGYAQLLQRDPAVNERQRSSLGAIESCGQHLLTLINDVLDLSKIEAGRLEIDLAPTDLHRLVQAVFDIVRPRAESKGLDTGLDVSVEVPRGIVTDATKLRQTLVNLLGNAVKFTESGSVSLHVKEKPGFRLELSIHDTGIGMSPTELSEIFDPFKQAEAGKASGGTGLGLAISRRIVEALDGALTVESTPGRGSVFTIDLPLVEVPEEELSEEVETRLTGASAVLAPGQDITIVIADDRSVNRDVLVQLLESAGFKTAQAVDGREAIDRLQETRAPLVLMDVRMPGMNGIDATRHIRAEDELRHTIVIAVTASVFPDFRARIHEAGFDDFIGKPFRAGDVFAKIEKHIGARFVHDEAVAAEVATDPTEAAALPLDRAAAIVARLRDGVRLGNVTALTALAAELEADDDTAPWGARIGELARAFDFPGLDRLAGELGDTTN